MRQIWCSPGVWVKVKPAPCAILLGLDDLVLWVLHLPQTLFKARVRLNSSCCLCHTAASDFPMTMVSSGIYNKALLPPSSCKK